jgi:RNA-directed DNA polymerase
MAALATFTFGGLSFRSVLIHANLILPCREAASQAFYLIRSRIFLKLRGLLTPASVRKLQRALYAKAKANPAYRFYALYDKIYRPDVLRWAWSCCRANGGGAGVDGQSFAGIEASGVEVWLEQLAQELRTKTYRPQAVWRVYIPKADGKQRPLGIPTIKDRVAQMAAGIVLEAISLRPI